MCRIAGIISKKLPITELHKQVKTMCDIMAHGGPDGEGFFVEEQFHTVFGHRRLAIIDLSEDSHQPMQSNNKLFSLSYNGEIYNYQALKIALCAEGYSFKTNGDTEVILAAYSIWGTKAFGKLEGMFAFALFDQTAQQTYLVRDSSGIKPLYYSTMNQQLIFASEIKAFKATGYFKEENPDWPTLFLAFGFIPEPYTTLKEVSMLPKKTYLQWNHQDQTFKIHSYNLAIEIQKETTLPTQLIYHKLDEAVQKHLIADAQIGVFLSGGLDSSIITLLSAQKLGHQLQTISINFDDELLSEEKYQQLIVQKTGSVHFDQKISEEEFTKGINQAINSLDQPSYDAINTWFIAKYAQAKGLKTVLSGVGADEYFGGYPSFKRLKYAKVLQIFPNFILRILSFLFNYKHKRIAFLRIKQPIGLYLFLRGSFEPKAIAKLLNINTAQVIDTLKKIDFPTDFNVWGTKTQASYLETNIFMQNQLLKDIDTMGMAHGLEIRVPFLDQQLIATLALLKEKERYGNRPKGLLIEAFKEILPKEIYIRKKMGFSFPMQQWLKNLDFTMNKNSRIDRKYAQSLLDQYQKDNLHWSKAMTLYQLINA